MKKIILTLGAAAIVLTVLSATGAEAGGKKFHFGWHNKPHWNNIWYDYPEYHCFWKKKIFTPKGWFWQKVKICKPVHIW